MTIEKYFEKYPEQDELNINIFIKFAKSNCDSWCFIDDRLVYDAGAYIRYEQEEKEFINKSIKRYMCLWSHNRSKCHLAKFNCASERCIPCNNFLPKSEVPKYDKLEAFKKAMLDDIMNGTQ